MIQIYYKNHEEFAALDWTWNKWHLSGLFQNISDACYFLRKRGYQLSEINDLAYMGIGIAGQVGGNLFYFQFYDTDAKEFVIIESPWKVGLNDFH